MSAGDFKTGTNLTGGVLDSRQVPAAETVLYGPVPAATYVKLSGSVACNTSGSTATLSLSVVKSGGTAGAANRVLSAWPLTASGTSTHNAKLAELEGITLGPGDFLSGLAGTAAAIAITITGVVSS